MPAGDSDDLEAMAAELEGSVPAAAEAGGDECLDAMAAELEGSGAPADDSFEAMAAELEGPEPEPEPEVELSAEEEPEVELSAEEEKAIMDELVAGALGGVRWCKKCKAVFEGQSCADRRHPPVSIFCPRPFSHIPAAAADRILLKLRRRAGAPRATPTSSSPRSCPKRSGPLSLGRSPAAPAR